jgi:hypothetical protein
MVAVWSTLVAFMTATTSGMLPSPDSNPQKPIPPKRAKPHDHKYRDLNDDPLFLNFSNAAKSDLAKTSRRHQKYKSIGLNKHHKEVDPN